MYKKQARREVPGALRRWFVVHFLVDMVAAIPIFLFPGIVLGFFGWDNIDPVTARLFAAALFGIGIASYIVKNSTIETYFDMLNLKIIWSSFAILGILLSMFQGVEIGNLLIWMMLLVFIFFNVLWIYWRSKL